MKTLQLLAWMAPQQSYRTGSRSLPVIYPSIRWFPEIENVMHTPDIHSNQNGPIPPLRTLEGQIIKMGPSCHSLRDETSTRLGYLRRTGNEQELPRSKRRTSPRIPGSAGQLHGKFRTTGFPSGPGDPIPLNGAKAVARIVAQGFSGVGLKEVHHAILHDDSQCNLQRHKFQCSSIPEYDDMT